MVDRHQMLAAVVGTQEKLNVSIQPGGEKNGAVFVALLSWFRMARGWVLGIHTPGSTAVTP